MQRPALFTNLALVLLGAGIFQIVAALLAIFVWLAGADWRSLIPQILVIAFWISWVLAYILWLKYIKAKKG